MAAQVSRAASQSHNSVMAGGTVQMAMNRAVEHALWISIPVKVAATCDMLSEPCLVQDSYP